MGDSIQVYLLWMNAPGRISPNRAEWQAPYHLRGKLRLKKIPAESRSGAIQQAAVREIVAGHDVFQGIAVGRDSASGGEQSDQSFWKPQKSNLTEARKGLEN